MFVFFDATGAVTHTISGPEALVRSQTGWIEVPEAALGDLADWRVEGGVLVRASLEGLRAGAIVQVNTLAGQVRSRYITTIPGQEMLYLQKEAEAKDWLAATSPDPADYPLISAEIGITGADADQVAQVYVNLAVILRTTAATLETARLGTVAAIEYATTVVEIEGALAVFRAGIASFPS